MGYFAQFFKTVTIFALCLSGSSEASKDAKPRFGFKSTNSSASGTTVRDAENPTLRTLIQDYQDLKTEMKFLRIKNEEFEERLDRYEANGLKTEQANKQRLDEVASTISQLISGGLGGIGAGLSIPVAFSTYLDEYGGLPYKLHDGTIVFNREITDNNNAYNPTTGVFTAPIDGVYLFSYFVAIYESSRITTFLTIDGDIVSSAISDSFFESNRYVLGGNVVIVHVSQGQKVQVKSNNDDQFLISLKLLARSTFSGFLIYVG